ncbi:MAG TPA: CHAT domain-containing protein [Polyangiaceae bacterium]|nr:CHAT domain-containing protein [Polyangiaceae bacterium]
MIYLDFFLDVRASSDTMCRVTVRSPQGECDYEISLPLNLSALSALRTELHSDALRLASAPRDMGARSGALLEKRDVVVEAAPKASSFELGESLYNAIFQGQVAELFAASREHAKHVGKGLRVNLVTHDGALALVPWELLCSRHGNHLCLSEVTPVVRYVLVDKPPAPLGVEPPLQILGVLSSGGGGPLELDDERSSINAALAPLRQKGLADVTWLENPTSQELLEALDRKDWHILHFAGHGTFDQTTAQGLLSIASEGGGYGHLRASDLRVLLRDRRSIRMVFLNACDGASGDARELFSSTAALVAEAGVPAVLAMQFPISDKVAAKFARQIYRQIAAGDSIEEAVTEARKGICVGGSLEWATPALFMRSAGGAFLRSPPPWRSRGRLAVGLLLAAMVTPALAAYLSPKPSSPPTHTTISSVSPPEKGPGPANSAPMEPSNLPPATPSSDAPNAHTPAPFEQGKAVAVNPPKSKKRDQRTVVPERPKPVDSAPKPSASAPAPAPAPTANPALIRDYLA